MSFPAAVAEQMILAALLSGTGSEKKNQFGLGLTALSLFLVFAGFGFLMAAGYGYLHEQFDMKVASFYMAAILLGCALATTLTASVLFYYHRKRARFYRHTVAENIRQAIASVGEELEAPIRENPKTAALIAGLAGYATAQKLH